MIESAARPEKILETAPEDRDGENPKYEVHSVSYSKDKDARWLKKVEKRIEDKILISKLQF